MKAVRRRRFRCRVTAGRAADALLMEGVLRPSSLGSFKGPREGGCVEDTEACGSYSGRRGRRAIGASSACLRGATVPDDTRVCRHDTILEAFLAHVAPLLL